MNKLLLAGIGGVTIICLLFAILRDVRYQKSYPGDLRNRVVGARLQMDGKLPYFYKWKSGDGIRYYDTGNFNSYEVSNITASPFLHDLLYPIANMQQKTIAYLWLLIEYILFFGLVTMTLLKAETVWQRIAVISVAIAFLFTYAWIDHVMFGQYYLLIPFLLMACYTFLRNTESFVSAIAAGLFAASLVLVRPNTLLIFLPLLFVVKRYSFRYKLGFMLPVVLLIGFSVLSSQQRSYWLDYKNSLVEQVKVHQNLNPAFQINEKDPEFEDWEGWNRTEVKKGNENLTALNYFEHGNVFVVVKSLTGIKLSPWILSLATVITIFIISLFYFLLNRKKELLLEGIVLLGFSFFMISDFFSPIYRSQYHGVEWLFPLLLIASRTERKYWIFYTAIAIGVILNMSHFSWIKMEHTIGEYLILANVLILSFIYGHRHVPDREIFIKN